jgi:TolB-like protein
VITVMARSQIDSVLRLMRRSPETPLDPVLAREVAVRAGARAVVTGELAPLGRRFVVTIRLVSARPATSWPRSATAAMTTR